MKGSLAAILRALVLPFGATSGARIILDGINGKIQIYNSSNVLVTEIDATGIDVNDGGGTASNITLDPSSPFPQILMSLADSGGHSFNDAVIQAYSDPNPDYTPILLLSAPGINAAGYDESSILIKSESITDPTARILLSTSRVDCGGPLYYNPDANWHSMSLQNGWANGGGADPPASYRLVASPPNSLQIVGSISGGTNANGTVIANLAASYRPTGGNKILFPVAVNGIVAGLSPRMEYQTNGDITIDQCTSATNIFFNAILPLDV